VLFRVFADIKNGYDSGMLKPARGLCLNQETLAILLFFFGIQARQQDGLECNHSINLRIAGLIHHSHGAATDFGHDLISSKTPGLPGFHAANKDRCSDHLSAGGCLIPVRSVTQRITGVTGEA